MANAKITTADGISLELEGTPEEVSAVVERLQREAGKQQLTPAKPGKKVVPSSTPARVLSLREEGFFDQQRSLGAIRDELQIHGWIYQLTALSGTVQTLVQKRELRRTLVSNGKKKVYCYVKP